MDNEKLKQFLIPILLLVVTIVGVIMLTPKTIDNFRGYTSTKQEIQTKTDSIKEKQAKLDEYRKKEAEEAAKEKASAASGKPRSEGVV